MVPNTICKVQNARGVVVAFWFAFVGKPCSVRVWLNTWAHTYPAGHYYVQCPCRAHNPAAYAGKPYTVTNAAKAATRQYWHVSGFGAPGIPAVVPSAATKAAWARAARIMRAGQAGLVAINKLPNAMRRIALHNYPKR